MTAGAVANARPAVRVTVEHHADREQHEERQEEHGEEDAERREEGRARSAMLPDRWPVASQQPCSTPATFRRTMLRMWLITS
jgi:hypothetical protein